MYCIKCGNQLNENDKFCTNCGSRINTVNAEPKYKSVAEPVSQSIDVNSNSTATKQIPHKPKKKTIIIVSSIVAAVLTAIIVVAVVIATNNSLEAKLTRGVWYCEKQDQYLQFFKNGTYERILRSGATKNGNWSINGNQLKMGSQSYTWRNDLNDHNIANHNVGNEYYSWYVSNKYFVYCNDSVYGADKSLVFE